MKKKLTFLLSALAIVAASVPTSANATTKYMKNGGQWDYGYSTNVFGHHVYSNFIYPTWHSSSAYMYTEEGTYDAYDDCSSYNWSNASTKSTWATVNDTAAYYNK